MRISILLPVFNGLKYLNESISGVLNQKYSHFEFLILDDNSSDGSYDYLSKINDSRVRVFRNEKNMGLFFSLNKLIAIARGELVVFWCQDDVMLPNALEIIDEFHIKHPEVAFSYAARKYINRFGQILEEHSTTNDLTPTIISPALHLKIAWFTGSISGNISALTFKRLVFEKYGLFKDDFIYSADFEFQIRVGLSENIGRIKETLFFQRMHNEQLSAQVSKSIFQLKEDLYVFDVMFKNTLNVDLIKYSRECMKWKRSNYYLSVLFNQIMHLHFNNAYKYFLILYKHPLITLNPFYFIAYYFGVRKKILLFD